ncbi:hypothetical protein DENSPDRAFT_199903 [Dentipellis sp. KUC8613]|nr:hypothetical protein DENSPDRAFT_199903 [Dentipellis sp. KUC8613]
MSEIPPSPILLPIRDMSPFVSSPVPSSRDTITSSSPLAFSSALIERTNTNTAKPPAGLFSTTKTTPISLGAHTITSRPASSSPPSRTISLDFPSKPAPSAAIPDIAPTVAPPSTSALDARTANLTSRTSTFRSVSLKEPKGAIDEEVRKEAELEVAREGARKRKRDEAIVRRLVKLRASTSTSTSSSAPSSSSAAEEDSQPDILAALDALETHVNSMNAQLHIEEVARRAAERQLREERRVLEDVRRECREPFVVPALLDAFVKLSRMGTDVDPGVQGSGR